MSAHKVTNWIVNNSDTLQVLGVSGAGFTAISFAVDIFFKVLVGIGTLYFLYLKIKKIKQDGKGK